MKFLLITLITHLDPAKTTRQRFREVVTTLSLLDPVRAFEDYATLDNLADGRLELIIGKGNGAAQAELFHVTAEDQWDRNRESYERWAHYGHDPARALVGAGSAGYYAARTSQEAIETYRPIFDARLAAFTRLGLTPVFPTLEDAIERSSILVGSPQQIIDKVHRYHAEFGHEVMHLHADADGLTEKQHRATLELLQSDIAPELRRSIPSRPLGGQ